MANLLNVCRRGAIAVACLISFHANAGVVIAATRVIFPAEQTEVTVKLSNRGVSPFLVRAWIDDGRPEVPLEQLRVPFRLMPPLFRLEVGKSQSLRIFHTGDGMPPDRESLYWLNVLEVPPKEQGNALQFSLRSRIKLFYRPHGLPGSSADAYQSLTWKMAREGGGWGVVATNPGPYHINLAKLDVHVGQQVISLNPSYISPFSSKRFVLEKVPRVSAGELHFSTIDDYGAVRDGLSTADSAPGRG